MIYSIFGDYGFLVTMEPKGHYVDINVEEICARDVKTNEILETKRYLKGSIKWDNCSHFWFGDEDKYADLKQRIAKLYYQHKGRYGYRRITAALK